MPELSIGDLAKPDEFRRARLSIGAILAWPLDRTRQDRYLAAARAAGARRRPPAKASGTGVAHWLIAEDGEAESRSVPEKLRALLTAGATLRACVAAADQQRAESAGRISLRAAFRTVEQFGEPHRLVDTNLAGIAAAWTACRSVAHFGAALGEMVMLERTLVAEPAALDEFLQRSLAYQHATAGIQAFHGQGRLGLIPAVEMWRIHSRRLERAREDNRRSGARWAWPLPVRPAP